MDTQPSEDPVPLATLRVVRAGMPARAHHRCTLRPVLVACVLTAILGEPQTVATGVVSDSPPATPPASRELLRVPLAEVALAPSGISTGRELNVPASRTRYHGPGESEVSARPQFGGASKLASSARGCDAR